MKMQLVHTFKDVISIENLLQAWREFIKGKRNKKDVQEFQLHLMSNIFDLHHELQNLTYAHGPYEAFRVHDPKPRNIHKASVRDRLLHHALYRVLYPCFNRTFIADSYSLRLYKGTHKAINQFRAYAYKASQNHTRTCFVLKGDIKKCFASVDQGLLTNMVDDYILDPRIRWLIAQAVGSFYATQQGVGLPLGNLTSQLLVNIYMNTFDQFVKHTLKVPYYIRYADDFVVLSHDKQWLVKLLSLISTFLLDRLQLHLHPHKVSISTLASGIDFLGWVHFPYHRVLRTSTRCRMLKNLAHAQGNNETLQSYLGLLKHGNTHKLQEQVKVLEWLYL